MCSTGNSGQGNKDFPDIHSYDATNYAKVSIKPPKYIPSPKHDKGGWGSPNPIKNVEEGQRLLDTGYKDSKQVYNVTSDGKIVKFQPDNSPENGYHSYEVSSPRDIPNNVRKEMENDGKLSKADSNKLRKGNVKKK